MSHSIPSAVLPGPPSSAPAPRSGAAGTRGRVPSLDGLRAISILLVLVGHLAGTRYFPFKTESYPLDFGNLGVRVFFVISGFLITGLLLKEMERDGRVSLPHFYFRRTLRIFPAALVLIGALVVADALGWVQLLPGDVLHALTYTTNYHPIRSWEVSHTWSLGVEEQFYLLWPAALLLLGRRWSMVAAAAFLVVSPLARVVFLTFPDDSLPRMAVGYSFETVADAIAVGCLLAGLRDRLWERRWYRALVETPRFAFLAAGALLVACMMRGGHLFLSDSSARIVTAMYYLGGVSVLNLVVAVMIDRYTRYPDSRFGRVLNAAPLVALGVMSYSVYLWQMPFLNAHRQDSLVTSFPVNLLFAFGCAWLAYRLVECPSLRLRVRLEKWWAGGRPAAAPAAVPAKL
jgi:peptidoglycan/LPS O-acetylase OafA/YrhL